MSYQYGVLHVNTSGADSTSPTMRIAKFVADEMGCPIVHDVASSLMYGHMKFDVLFVKYGLLAFSQHRETVFGLLERAGRVINLENDYTFVPDRRLRAADETWSTVEGRTRLVNWNVLTRRPLSEWGMSPSLMREPQMAGVVYYGAHREGRVPYFRRYFRDAPYPVTISTFSPKSKAAFRETCGDAVGLTSAFRQWDGPADWEMTVYCEDEASHDLYCSPANRFYECVQMGLAQAVDANSAATLTRGGVGCVEKYVVSSQKEVKKLLKYADEVRRDQRVLWYRNYGQELRAQFRRARKESGL